MYSYRLADSPEFANGILRGAGYVEAGLVGALLVLFATTASALGTRSEIPRLMTAPQSSAGGPRMIFSQLRETLADRSLLSLLAAAILGGTAAGAVNVLWVYNQ